jgi:hypothetical protein
MIIAREKEEAQPVCMGFALFTQKCRSDENFSMWLEPLKQDFNVLASAGEIDVHRLRDLQSALIDLIELIDNPPRRFSRAQLGRLS